jgi:recombination protein RecT
MSQPSSNLPARVSSVNDLRGFLEKFKPSLKQLLPPTLPVEKLFQIVVFNATVNLQLLGCEVKSMLKCVWQAHTLGLEVGTGLAHLVPFWNSQRNQLEAQLIIDYKGYIHLALGSKKVSRIYARVVYANEKFKINETDSQKPYKHDRLPPSKRGNKHGAYAIAYNNDGVVVGAEFLFAEEIEEIKKKALANKKNPSSNPWNTNEEAMWQKTPVRRMAKYLPLSPEFLRAATLDEHQEEGLTAPVDPEIDLGFQDVVAEDHETKTLQKQEELKKQFQAKQEPDIPMYNPPPTGPGTPTDQNDPGPLDPESKEGVIVDGELVEPKPEPPEPKPPKSAVVKGKKSSGDDNLFGPPVGPKLEGGKKVDDYILGENMVQCPPGGERQGQMTNTKGYCNSICKYRKRCFLFVDQK